MNARTQAGVLLAFGAVLLRLATGTALLRYVNPASRPWVLMAGVIMVGLAGVELGQRRRKPPPDHVAPAERRRASVLVWAVLAPVAVVALVAPPALGSFTALRSHPVNVDARRADYPPLPAQPDRQPTALTTIEFVSRALTRGGDTLTGRSVALTGFVLRPLPGGFLLGRLVITCCAADAAPVEIRVLDHARAMPVNSWVQVVGTGAGVEQTDGEPRARISATGVTAVPSPTNPYEH